MSDIKVFFSELSSGSKSGLLFGFVLIIALIGYFAFVFLIKDYGVLYKELEDADASNIVAGLKKLKIEHQIADGGSTILVGKDQVNDARLSLMSEGVMLNKTVGLEIFDNTDYGMTEFAQKVNFQRAIQGEIARTLMALSEIKFARVHLTLPKDSIFADQQKQAKASITIIKEAGHFLAADQILGIQRLVASSVDELPVENVVVVDERGLDISIKSTSDDSHENSFIGSTILNKKREYELHLQQKVERILSRGLGKEQFAVSIDVEIDASKTTLVSESLLSPTNSESGYLKRENTNVKFVDQLATKGDSKRAKASEETSNEYLYGKEVKQTEFLGGGIKSISVAVLLADSVDDSQVLAIQQLVGASVGISLLRGDIIQVQKLTAKNEAMIKNKTQEAVDVTAAIDLVSKSIPQLDSKPLKTSTIEPKFASFSLLALTTNEMFALLAFLVSCLIGVIWYRRTRSRNHRAKVLADISGWLESSHPSVFEAETENAKVNV